MEEFKEFKPLPEERWPEPREVFKLKWPHRFFRRIYTNHYHRGIRLSPFGDFMIGTYVSETGFESYPASEYWMHNFFPPLMEEELETMEAHFGFELPRAFREWFSFSNGGTFYADHLNMYGWMNERFSRFAVGTGLWSIRKLNTSMHLRGAPEHLWFFGNYTLRYETHNYLYLDRQTGLVHQTVNEDDWTPRGTWESVEALFEEAADNLDTYWNERGVRVKPYEGELEYRAEDAARMRAFREEKERKRQERNRRRREAYRRKKEEAKKKAEEAAKRKGRRKTGGDDE